MADDSIDIIEPFDFHPCNSPRGMQYYDLNVLTADQQNQLNDFKRNLVRENEKYLAIHPEVRALIALITRHVMTHRPRTDIPEFVGQFFARSKIDLEHEMRDYIRQREPHIYEGDSAVCIHRESTVELAESIVEEEQEEQEERAEPSLVDLPQYILDEILEKAYKRLGIDIDNLDDANVQAWMYSTESSESIVKEVIREVLGRMEDETHKIITYLQTSEIGETEGSAEFLLEQQEDEKIVEEQGKEDEKSVEEQEKEAETEVEDVEDNPPDSSVDVEEQLKQSDPTEDAAPAEELPLGETEVSNSEQSPANAPNENMEAPKNE